MCNIPVLHYSIKQNLNCLKGSEDRFKLDGTKSLTFMLQVQKWNKCGYAKGLLSRMRWLSHDK